jgi:hypothetical protein
MPTNLRHTSDAEVQIRNQEHIYFLYVSIHHSPCYHKADTQQNGTLFSQKEVMHDAKQNCYWVQYLEVLLENVFMNSMVYGTVEASVHFLEFTLEK